MYGELITCKARSSSAPPQIAAGASRKRRRRRRRKHKLNTPLSSVTARQTNREDMPSSTAGRAIADSDASAQSSTFTSTSLLVSYGDSSTSAGESDDAGERSGRPEAIGHLPIPEAIHDLYADDNPPVVMLSEKQTDQEKSHTLESSEEETLGFFQSCSEEEEDDDYNNDGRTLTSVSLMAPSGERIPEVTKRWSEKSAQWLFGPSQLSSYTCWKCSHVGHLAQDCTVAVRDGVGVSDSGAEAGGTARARIPRSVQNLLAACREIKRKKGQRCADCGIRSNLVSCLDCG